MRASSLLALVPLAMAAPTERSEGLAPVLVARNVDLVHGHYIVKMKKSSGAAAAVASAVSSIAAGATHKYDSVFHGFASHLTESELATLRKDPNVEYIEQDAIVSVKTVESKSTVRQTGSTWGLSRISSANAGGSTYTYDSSAGAGTCAYIIDTGIDVTHPEFEGRAKFVANFASGTYNNDVFGHGTHVSGTVGSKTYGVAKKTTLYAVKSLGDDGTGVWSQIISGMNFVANDMSKRNCPNGVGANMSVGGDYSQSVNDAASNLGQSGVFVSVAGGNESRDASYDSPASAYNVCTIGATTSTDALASYSNYGDNVNVLAPGSNVISTYPGGGTKSLSGTSMATPHALGVALYYWGLGKGYAGAQQCSYLVSTALSNKISGLPYGTPNKLVNNGFRS